MPEHEVKKVEFMVVADHDIDQFNQRVSMLLNEGWSIPGAMTTQAIVDRINGWPTFFITLMRL